MTTHDVRGVDTTAGILLLAIVTIQYGGDVPGSGSCPGACRLTEFQKFSPAPATRTRACS